MPEMRISEYVIPGNPAARGTEDVLICLATQRDGSSKWAVRNRLGACMNKRGKWEDEPQNSSRSDAFLARCRFDSVEEAAAALGVKVPDAWHEAVLAECMATEGCYRESDPVGTIRALVDWHCKTVAGIAGVGDVATHKLVPLEPTEGMVVAAMGRNGPPAATYKAMVSAAPDADVPQPADAPDMQEIQSKLTKIMVAGCTCMTKTPELKYHDERCHYRLAAEVSLMLGNAPIMRNMVKPAPADALQAPVRDTCCHQTVLMGEDGPAYCADCPLRKHGRSTRTSKESGT